MVTLVLMLVEVLMLPGLLAYWLVSLAETSEVGRRCKEQSSRKL